MKRFMRHLLICAQCLLDETVGCFLLLAHISKMRCFPCCCSTCTAMTQPAETQIKMQIFSSNSIKILKSPLRSLLPSPLFNRSAPGLFLTILKYTRTSCAQEAGLVLAGRGTAYESYFILFLDYQKPGPVF